MAAATGILGANVFMRYVFSAPIAWAEEVAIRLIIWLVFVGCSILVREHGHLAVDLLPRALPQRGRALLNGFIWCVSGCFFIWLFLLGAEHTYRTYQSGQILPMLQAPIWLAYLAVPVGSALMICRIAQHILYFFRYGVDYAETINPSVSE